MRVRILTTLATAGMILGACASAGVQQTHRQQNVITQEQVKAYNGESVYLLIQSQHPSWLRERGRASMRLSSPVMVYFDGMPQPGGVDALRSLMPRQVLEITYLDSRAATTRFGTGNGNGAILVTLR